jgi:hypothetical protein
MKMEQTECSETSALKIQTPGNNPEESIQNLEHGESLKSRIVQVSYAACVGTVRYLLCVQSSEHLSWYTDLSET